MSVGLAIFLGKYAKDRIALGLLSMGVSLSVGVVLMYYLTFYHESGLDYWLNTGFNRMYIPAMIFLQSFGFLMMYRLIQEYTQQKA